MLQNLLRINIAVILVSGLFIAACSAQQTEEQALQSLRQMALSGKLPPEDFVANLESRFAGKKTGALAKLLRARIKLEQNDFAGAAAVLNSDVFKKQTRVADYVLWLRGKALQSAGNYAEAMNVLVQLVREHPDSIRYRDAKLLWAASAMISGKAVEVPPMLIDLSEKNDGDALLATAKAYEAQNSPAEAVKYFRRTYFFAAGSAAGKEAEAKLASLGKPLTPQNTEGQLARADRLFTIKSFAESAAAYAGLASAFPQAMTPDVLVRRITAVANTPGIADGMNLINSLPTSAVKEREQAYRQLVLGYAKAKQWTMLRSTVDAMRAAFPSGSLVVKTMIDAGMAAREGKNRTDEAYFFNTAVAAYPNAVEVAVAQFESSWVQHESGNFQLSSQMLTDHLARYADKDTANRGKAGYWAARDSERAGKTAEACSLYDGVIYRYGANWYGYLALSRLSAMKSQGNCRLLTPPNPTIAQAVANLKTVSVAPETAGEKELTRAGKSDELSTIGLFDWAIDELNEAKKTSPTSPKINLALARHYRWKGDNTSALIAMQKPYPDYAQMFPEEMDRETWSFFYPLTNWPEIKRWSADRGLDSHQVAGFIRQETVFNPSASSPANAYGLMQLLLPTAKTVARKYNASFVPTSPADLFQPSLNIELGTAYMKDQFAKFGRVEYVAVAYNAGPGHVPQWRATLPAEMDEFVEQIPFKETKQYVQGIIRNSAQYRRLYDDSGNFRPNVGTRPLRSEMESKPHEQFTAENPDVMVGSEAFE